MPITFDNMNPSIDFLKHAIPEVKEEQYHDELKKIVDNFEVTKAAADTDEKKAYAYALYVNNAIALASYLFRKNVLTEELEKEYHTLPTEDDAQAVLEEFKKASEEEKSAITERQQKFINHSREMEVFKGIALGDSPEEAESGVAGREQRMAQMEQQR